MKNEGILKRMMNSFLEGFLPAKTKRMILLSSLLAYIQGTKSPDQQLVCKLNHLLKLSNNDKSIMVPPLLNERIWGDVVSRTEPLSKDGFMLSELSEIKDFKVFSYRSRFISDRIIRRTPSWLRYGSNKQIREDLIALLTNLHQFSIGGVH